MNLKCPDCKKEFPSRHSLDCHVSRESKKLPDERCGRKEDQRQAKIQKQNDFKETKNKIMNDLSKCTTVVELENFAGSLKKINELEVQLKLKSEENEELKCKEFQGCKLPASIIARRSMTEPERRLILEKQGNKCAGVNCKLSSLSGYAYDIDHKVPIQFGGNNDECNLQALCTECHRNKDHSHHDSKDHLCMQNSSRFDSECSISMYHAFTSKQKKRV